MTELLLQPVSVNNLISLVLYLVVLGYLLSVRGKSRATWWLAVAFAGLSLLGLAGFLGSTLYSPAPWMSRVLGLLFFAGTGVFLWSYLHFAYRFLENPFKREARIALWVTGLGLSMSYDIVTQGHGGTLAVESEEGAGAAFSVVRLPATPASVPQPAKSASG